MHAEEREGRCAPSPGLARIEDGHDVLEGVDLVLRLPPEVDQLARERSQA